MTSQPSPPTLPLSGRCMCEAVRYEVKEPLLGALYCHCRRCQRRTGTAFSVSALTAPGSFEVVAGEDHLQSWDPGDGGWVKVFCRTCGSQTHTTHPDQPELVAVRLGEVEGDPGVRPSAHQFTDYAAAWQPLPEDGLPRFPERLPASPRPGD